MKNATPARAFYSLVQYVPDGSRAEAANAGVLLYVPSKRWLDVIASPSLERVRHFFRPGKQELRRIELALEALKVRMGLAREEFDGEDDLTRFIAARADAVRMTPPRLLMVASDPQAELVALYDELVGDAPVAVRSQKPALPPRVAEIFGRLQAERRVWRPGSIEVPTVKRRFTVPIAFRNGRINYVKPESLTDNGNLDSRLAQLGFNGQLIYKHPVNDEEGQLIVLSSDPSARPETEKRFKRTLEEFHVDVVPFKEAEGFARKVERTAH